MRKLEQQSYREVNLTGKMVPLCVVEYPDEKAFPIETFDIFYHADLADDDPFTSIVRVNVFHESSRDEMRQALRERLLTSDAERLIKFLDANDWDVSFFVDAYEG